MIIMGALIMIIGLIGVFAGIKKNNIMVRNISIVIVGISFLMMIVPLFLLGNG